MKNILISWIFVLAGHQLATAQEYKWDGKDAKKLAITQLYGKINIMETTGTQLVITVDDLKNIEIPDKAKGLKPIGSSILPDNTGLGLNVEASGTTLKLKGAIKQSMDAQYTFKVPKGISVMIDYNNPFTYGDIDVSDFSSELEVTTLKDNINLKNVTGPLVLHSVSGNINIDFGTVNQNSPISVSSISGEIDAKFPAATPANLKFSTISGEIFTDFDVHFPDKEKEGLSYIGGGKGFNGKINNGGVEIDLSTISSNMYIRKK